MYLTQKYIFKAEEDNNGIMEFNLFVREESLANNNKINKPQ